jgi:predicted extracellular nuclease
MNGELKIKKLKMRLKPKLKLGWLLICLWGIAPIQGQTPFRVMFYNLENLFDTEDDPQTNDNEFTPEGVRHWTNTRYYTKINHLAKVITSIGEWDTPVLIGVCEVENEKGIDDLIAHSPLRKMQYRSVITHSKDARGIDVALLYQRDQFKYLYHDSIRIHFPDNKKKRTRDVLHVTGEVLTGDTLDVFVCHFPSRRGGQIQSESSRFYVASVVKAKTDSLMQIRKNANILIMGDFNDEPSDNSLRKGLKANPLPTDTIHRNALYNLFLSVEKNSDIGSYKFGGHWNFLDQIIVSGNLLIPNRPFHVLPETATIFQKLFLLTEDKASGGMRPKKTFSGYKYEEGYSDHLPVFVDFVISGEE